MCFLHIVAWWYLVDVSTKEGLMIGRLYFNSGQFDGPKRQAAFAGVRSASPEIRIDEGQLDDGDSGYCVGVDPGFDTLDLSALDDYAVDVGPVRLHVSSSHVASGERRRLAA